MPGLSKVIVLDPDARASRQVQLGFEREGVPTQAIAAGPGPLELPGGEAGLVVVGGVDGQALDLVRRVRAALTAQRIDAPIVFAGRGVQRSEACAAGADEAVLQPAYLRDIVTIGRLLRGVPAHQRDHLVGSLIEITGVYTLVRALAALGRSATLTLVRGLRRGEIRFYHGEVTSAQVGLIHGQAALHQLLLWTDARFDFHHEAVVRRQQIPLSPDELFADAERFLEGVRDSSGGLSPSLVLEPNLPRVQSLGKQIPTEVYGVLRMFDGHRLLADVLEDSAYRVFETLRVAQRAVDVGLLRAVDRQPPRPTWRAVLAVEDWLVGNQTRDTAVDAVIPGAPVAPPEPGRGKSHKRRNKKKRRVNTTQGIGVGAAPVEPKPDIDWGSLVPRIVGAEVGPLAGVVPATHVSGEIVAASVPPASQAEPQLAMPTVVFDEAAEVRRREEAAEVRRREEAAEVRRREEAAEVAAASEAEREPPCDGPAQTSPVDGSIPARSEGSGPGGAKAPASDARQAPSDGAAVAAGQAEASEASGATGASEASETSDVSDPERRDTVRMVAEPARAASEPAALAVPADVELDDTKPERLPVRRASAVTPAGLAAGPPSPTAGGAAAALEAGEPATASVAAEASDAPTAKVAAVDPGDAPTAKVAAIDPGDAPTAKIAAVEPGDAATARRAVPADAVAADAVAADAVAADAVAADDDDDADASGATTTKYTVPSAAAPVDSTPAEITDEPSDGVIRDHIATAETTPVKRRWPPSDPYDDDLPSLATGEITLPRGRAVVEPPAACEPSVLISDLAEAHAMVSAAAHQMTGQSAGDMASPAREAAVCEARSDAVAFSEVEEAFFRAGHDKDPARAVAHADSFDDLDQDYRPVGFWDKLRGKTAPRKK